MARAIFQDWFVDFGSTRTQAEGRAVYLTTELWDLFPNTLTDEEKPDGWDISEIGKEVDAVGGATPSTKESFYWETASTTGPHLRICRNCCRRCCWTQIGRSA